MNPPQCSKNTSNLLLNFSVCNRLMMIMFSSLLIYLKQSIRNVAVFFLQQTSNVSPFKGQIRRLICFNYGQNISFNYKTVALYGGMMFQERISETVADLQAFVSFLQLVNQIAVYAKNITQSMQNVCSGCFSVHLISFYIQRKKVSPTFEVDFIAYFGLKLLELCLNNLYSVFKVFYCLFICRSKRRLSA